MTETKTYPYIGFDKLYVAELLTEMTPLPPMALCDNSLVLFPLPYHRKQTWKFLCRWWHIRSSHIRCDHRDQALHRQHQQWKLCLVIRCFLRHQHRAIDRNQSWSSSNRCLGLSRTIGRWQSWICLAFGRCFFKTRQGLQHKRGQDQIYNQWTRFQCSSLKNTHILNALSSADPIIQSLGLTDTHLIDTTTGFFSSPNYVPATPGE